MQKYAVVLGTAMLAAAFFGCYVDSGATATDDAGTTNADGGTGTGVPCDVSTVLLNQCQMCHGTTLKGGAPISLVTRDDLMAPSTVDSSMTVAERAVARMGDTAKPMPPLPMAAAAQSDIDTLNNWIAAGYPAGSCAQADPGPSPYDTGVTCTSGTTWSGFNGPTMLPGRACIQCHGAGIAAGGTVYPSAHEPNNCIGAGSQVGITGAVVTIIDANNKAIGLGVNTTGDFYTTQPIAKPYTAKVSYQGRERWMMTPQTSGDCNSCHTQDGANGAPGRIMLP